MVKKGVKDVRKELLALGGGKNIGEKYFNSVREGSDFSPDAKKYASLQLAQKYNKDSGEIAQLYLDAGQKNQAAEVYTRLGKDYLPIKEFGPSIVTDEVEDDRIDFYEKALQIYHEVGNVTKERAIRKIRSNMLRKKRDWKNSFLPGYSRGKNYWEDRTHRDKIVSRLEKSLTSFLAIGVLAGIFFLSPNMTGNAIADLSTKTSSFIGIGLLIIALIAGFYLMNRKKKKTTSKKK